MLFDASALDDSAAPLASSIASRTYSTHWDKIVTVWGSGSSTSRPSARHSSDRATSTLLSGGLAHIQAQQQIRTWFHTGDHPELTQRWLQRLVIIGEDIYGDSHRPTIERIDIAAYPETVVLTRLLTSPYWRERDDLLAEAGRQFGTRLQDTASTG
ncbi:MAG: hypothetical protein ABIQ18_45950 [Umezawaea sp.]